ncbi:MAG TPA: restriction endonuclease subunit S [Chitinophagales bacterium]|nr:restriction endonuclease subunit S [Chitinophagales bacterium]
MPTWKKYKLEEIASKLGDGLHGTPHYDKEGEYFFINGSNLINGKVVILPETKRVDAAEYNKHKKQLSDRTILLGINGTIGNVAIYNNEKCILGKSACYINVSEKFDLHFIKYVLLNKDFQNYIRNNATGSVIKNVGLKSLREYEILIPTDLPTQTRIASILSALDDKIELNRQMNQTLEQMAQALFKKYFLECSGEKTGMSLLDFADLLTGGTPKTSVSEYWNGDIFWISAKDVTPNAGGFIIETERKISERGLTESHAKLLPTYSTVITARGTVGNCCILSSPMAISQSNYALKPKKHDASFVLFRIVMNSIDELKRNSYGTVFDTITTKTLQDIKILFPADEVIEKLEFLLKPLYKKIMQSEFENQALTKLRNTLLPKLMSGEIEVNTPVADEILS